MGINASCRAWSSILRGLGLGCLASVLGSLVLVLIELMLPEFEDGFYSLLLDWKYWGDIMVFLFIGFFLSFLFSAVPGSLGGAVIGLILYILATRNTLSKGMAVLVGLLVGGLSGYLSLQLANLKVDIVLEMTDLVILATVVATLAGGWVGKQMGDYVQRNVK